MIRRRDVPRGVIGMVHLLPLPGSPRWDGDLATVLHRATADARALAEGGVDAILVENYGDAPFFKDRVEPVTVAAMTRAVSAVARSVEELGRTEPLPMGVNVLRNDAEAALSIAAATGASFIRVNIHTGGMHTDQGWIEGRAAETVRLRESVAPEVAILADVHVKHAVPPVGERMESAAADAWHRGLADALIVTGSATGESADPGRLEAVRNAVPEAPLIVGSGVTRETVRAILANGHAVIVGSALQRHGTAGGVVEVARVRDLVGAVRE